MCKTAAQMMSARELQASVIMSYSEDEMLLGDGERMKGDLLEYLGERQDRQPHLD